MFSPTDAPVEIVNDACCLCGGSRELDLLALGIAVARDDISSHGHNVIGCPEFVTFLLPVCEILVSDGPPELCSGMNSSEVSKQLYSFIESSAGKITFKDESTVDWLPVRPN